MTNNDNIHRLTFEDKEITLIGTAHVSRESADLVVKVIEEEKPDTVCIELCDSRYKARKIDGRIRISLRLLKKKNHFFSSQTFCSHLFRKKLDKNWGSNQGRK